MKVFLAGQNGAHKIQYSLIGGAGQIEIYLAGGVSGNLKPAWKRVASHPQISKDTILDEMAEYGGTGDENIMRVFLAGGETRHWIPERMFVEADEDISRRRSTVERGGYIRLCN